MEKIAAHREGLLHRAFSVLVFNSKGELLLQKRAEGKYHSPGLWSNTCCGHPRPGEDIGSAARRRLVEEMGLGCELEPAFTFRYEASMGNGLAESEMDHVFIGSTDDLPSPNADEVSDWRYVDRTSLEQGLSSYAARFTVWLPLCVWRAWDHHVRGVRGS